MGTTETKDTPGKHTESMDLGIGLTDTELRIRIYMVLTWVLCTCWCCYVAWSCWTSGRGSGGCF